MSLLVLLDLSKAFDSVSHKFLTTTLGYYNLFVPWFEDYLANRSQCTKINGLYSEFAHLDFGVPQGSILGPIFFVIFINKIETALSKFKHQKWN